ncbi:hypothetical protein [Brumimicrobium aurantiacum]|uniref:Uncharacterized protein n=1 Tax=Brumimicrobium aurantiacum TaxID=1737063 RepID=A0A3E1EVK9_9FLAO|nr:hypothetical protein [Brumimicrobium aurantiacum]RFC53595.1 hypothetical protein DXU93_12580 [Brumimicrobium aurantiacum]
MSLEIPNDFNSDTDDKPFIRCKVCDRDLSESQTPYTIEKAYKRVDEGEDVTLFEVAICIPCAEKQGKKMSKESRAYMMKMMGNASFIEKRQKRWEEDWRADWKSACLFSDEEIKINDEYHIVGQFQNGKIIPSMTPFVIGQSYIEEIQENLSLETKEEMDRFGEQFLGPDPALRALLKDHQFVIV